MFHPASLLLLWGAGVVAVQSLSLMLTLLMATLLVLVALIWARSVFPRLLKRSRWLFLTMGLLFLWLSPGVRLPAPWGNWGLTWDGLQLAAEHLARLCSILALVALLLSRLTSRQIVSGLYFLTPRPSPSLGFFARSLAVRLALTLTYIAGKTDDDWKVLLQRQADPLPEDDVPVRLTSQPWTWRDSLITVAGGSLAMGLLFGGGGP